MTRHSIRWKIVGVFALTILSFQIIFFLMSAFLLDDILSHGAKEAMAKQFKAFTVMSSHDNSSNAYQETLENLSFEFGTSMTFVNVNTNEVMTTSPGMMRGGMRMNRSQMYMRMIDEYSNLSVNDFEFRILKNIEPGKQLQLLTGRVKDGYVILEKPIIAVHESLGILRGYIGFSSIGLIVLGTLIFFNFSKKLIQPILEIEKQARAIAGLNFELKTSVTGKDEIGQLGIAMNSIADRLRIALHELQIANEKLKNEIEAERRLEKMRRSFVSNVSHELKTPLSMIMGYADGLKNQVVRSPESMEEYVDVIVEESQKMNWLIKDLLDLSAYENGTFKLKTVEIDFSSALKRMLSAYADRITSQSVHVITDIEKDIHIKLDVVKMEQVFRNLMDNALKHVTMGGNIWVSCHLVNQFMELTIENQGNNIPNDELGQIWGSFFRGRYDLDHGFDGTGLGLSIVKAVVEGHAGKSEALNTESGVKILIRLPITE